MNGASQAEAMLLDAGDTLARALRRAQQRAAAVYPEMVEWAAHLRISRGLSPNTGANYIDAVVLLLEYLAAADVELKSANAGLVERWQQRLYVERREKAATRHVKLVGVRCWFDWRERTGRGPNPIRGVQGPRRERPAPRKYTMRQLQAILGSCDRQTVKGRRDYALLLFFLSTGARRMEVAALRLGDIELRERVGVVRFWGKGAKERTLTFEGPVIAALRDWLSDRDSLPVVDSEALFLSLTGPSKGRQLRNGGLDGVVARAIKRARLKLAAGYALHVLRSTFATAMYDSGKDIETIRILLGHEHIETTRIYIAISERQLKARLPKEFLEEVTGEGKRNGLPLWAQQRLG